MLIRKFNSIVRAVEPWGVLLAVLVFILEYRNKIEERVVWAWQLVTTEVSGNGGKKEALEYLNKRDGFLCYSDYCLLEIKKRANLSEIDLSAGARESGAYIPFVDLPGANLALARLSKANLYGANLHGAILEKADLEKADLQNCVLIAANLTGANLTEANLRGCNLNRARLVSANFEYADLSSTNLEEADLTDANMKEVNFRKSNLRGASLTKNTILFSEFCNTIMPDGSICSNRCDGEQGINMCSFLE